MHIQKKKLRVWIIIALALIGVRVALPFIVRDYINYRLSQLSGYRGHVEQVHLKLWRGAYTLVAFKMEKIDGQRAYPFTSIDRAFLSLQWKQIFHGALVGYVILEKPIVNYVIGKTEKDDQLTPPENWQKQITEFFPLTINELTIDEGEVHFRDLRKSPEINLFAQEINGTGENLTNNLKTSKSRFASIAVEGKVMTKAPFLVSAKVNILKNPTEAFIKMDLKNLDLIELNDAFRTYAKFDVKGGAFSLFTEVDINNNKIKGYAKPLLDHVVVFKWSVDKKKPPLKILWQGIVAFVSDLFRNQSKNRIAAKIPIEGVLDDPNTDIWATLGSILKNSFVKALQPDFDHGVTIPK